MYGRKILAVAELTARCFDLERLADNGSAWLFGSRAAGCACEGSDWDVLVLSRNGNAFSRRRISQLDVVTVPWPSARARVWLESELAAHVAWYGVLLTGREDWIDEIDTRAASRRKAMQTCGRITAVSRAWSNLSARYRRERALGVRRDVQRALALADRGTVPPTFYLDEEWSATSPRDRKRAIDRLNAELSPELLRAMVSAGVHRPPGPLTTAGRRRA